MSGAGGMERGPVVAGRPVRDHVVETIYARAGDVARLAVRREPAPATGWDDRLDGVLTSPALGVAAMLGLMGLLFWITLVGANYPSRLLGALLFGLQDRLTVAFSALGAPAWIHGLLVLGVYRTLAWVVSVMLPPMAIFFPLFTMLEDLGYLPRVAFNLDRLFRWAGAHGKQSLTMCMGFGCNAAGVTACRVIDSPRERLVATLTNNFVPCNGRLPLLATISAVFFGGVASAAGGPAAASLIMLGLIVLGVAVTLGVSWLLSRTALRGVPSAFVLELPPYRVPQLGRVLVRSILDRTLFVLGRAVTIAAPAGGLVWILANVSLGGQSLLLRLANLLAPAGRLLGMDGFILSAFLLALPANEIVLPILLMSYLSAGSMLSLPGPEALRAMLVGRGWTSLTAACVMLFSLLHFPCGTTLLTVRRETGSWRWTALAALVPTVVAALVCLLVAQLGRAFGL